jgi:hypothetical protein
MKTFDVKYLGKVAIGLDGEEVMSRFRIYVEQAGNGSEFRVVCKEDREI